MPPSGLNSILLQQCSLSVLLVPDQDPDPTAERGTTLPEIIRATVVITTVVSVATVGLSSTTVAEDVATSHEETTTEVVAPMVSAPTTGTATEISSSRTTTLTVPGGAALARTRRVSAPEAEAALVIPTGRLPDDPGTPALPHALRPHGDAVPEDHRPKMPRQGVRPEKARQVLRKRRSLEEALQKNPVASGRV